MLNIKSLILVSTFLMFSGVANADIFDRITNCENSGGGSCLYDLLRELASQPSDNREIIRSGTYGSEGHEMTISSYGNTVTISGTNSIGERGTYECIGNSCTGSRYNFTITNRHSITMSYGRVWNWFR